MNLGCNGETHSSLTADQVEVQEEEGRRPWFGIKCDVSITSGIPLAWPSVVAVSPSARRTSY